MTDVSLALGAEANPLASWLADLVQQNRRRQPRTDRALRRLRATVAVVAPDRRQAATLRFDHGHLTIHHGMVGVPDLTLCGDYQTLLGLSELRPHLLHPGWRQSSRELFSGDLKIYGLLTHPRLFARLLQVLARY